MLSIDLYVLINITINIFTSVKMPQNARALIAFGPYEACYLVEHRKTRLQGLESRFIGIYILTIK